MCWLFSSTVSGLVLGISRVGRVAVLYGSFELSRYICWHVFAFFYSTLSAFVLTEWAGTNLITNDESASFSGVQAWKFVVSDSTYSNL